ncbi:MAG: hypothetical protein IPN33_21985 [Saprospiraceae bacterium]|nr:hypothetical protein [Saprospiraceae bacterium]
MNASQSWGICYPKDECPGADGREVHGMAAVLFFGPAPAFPALALIFSQWHS